MTMVGIKHDNGKEPWHHMPWRSLREVLWVFQHGAKKYGWDNWREVEPIERYYDAAFRHLIAFTEGHEIDEDSCLHSLAHVIANCLIIMEKENGHDPDRKHRSRDHQSAFM